MTGRLVFLLCVFFCCQIAEGQVKTQVQPALCEECEKHVNPHVDESRGLGDILKEIILGKKQVCEQRPPDTNKIRIGDSSVDGWGECPLFPKTFQISSDERETFSVKLRREKYTETVPAHVGKNAAGRWVTLPEARVEKQKCEIEFPTGCGSIIQKDCRFEGGTAPIAKLDWLKSTLGGSMPAICGAAVNAFANKCGPWAGLSPDQRKAEAFRLIDLAVKNFTVGLTATKIPPPPASKGQRPGEPYSPERSHYLTPHLLQCLMHRENHEFEPNKLNYTECNQATSTANGLFQILESTAHYLSSTNETVSQEGLPRFVSKVGNLCYQFAPYWQQVLDPHAKPRPEFANADIYPKPKTCGEMAPQDFVNVMSGYPEFQVAMGTAMVNYFLEMTEHYGVKEIKGRRRQIPPQKGHDNIVRTALDEYWFTTGNPEDSASVMKCEKCLDKNGGGCLK